MPNVYVAGDFKLLLQMKIKKLMGERKKVSKIKPENIKIYYLPSLKSSLVLQKNQTSIYKGC